MTRIRTRASGGHRGTKTASGSTLTDNAWTQLTETCVDDVGKGSDHGLNISRFSCHIEPFNGTYRVAALPSASPQFKDWNGFLSQQLSTGHLVLPASPSDGALATTTLARTNPSRADISVFNFIHELKDLPGMFHDIMAIKLQIRNFRSLSSPDKVAANHYLAGVMGWKPLISDIRKFLDFQSKVDRRVTELQRLYSGGMTRKLRKNLDDATASAQTKHFSVESGFGYNIYCSRSIMTTRKTWTSVRWRPVVIPADLSDTALRRKARSLVFGINVQPRYLWDALPWTWLIDWSANIGEYLGAHSNVVPAISSLPLIMRHTKTVSTVTRDPDAYTTVSGGSASGTYETKYRGISPATLSASFPFLSGNQLSILGALFIQRKPR